MPDVTPRYCRLLLHHELHRCPDCDGGEGVEDLLDPLVQLPDVVHLHPGVGDLDGARELLVSHVSHLDKLEI